MKSVVSDTVSNVSQNAQVEALQKLLLAKEKEVGRLQQHIDKQDQKVNEL